MQNSDVCNFYYGESWSLWDDFPELFTSIEIVDAMLFENAGQIIPYRDILLCVDCTCKQLTKMLRHYATYGLVSLGMASFCHIHKENILDEEGYCKQCDCCWRDEQTNKLEYAIKIEM